MFGKNIILDKNILRTNKIPLLAKDPSWIRLFGKLKEKDIENAKEELLNLLTKERELDKEGRKLHREKQNAMKMILGISDSVNNENKLENIGLLDEYKHQLEKVNDELDLLQFQLETLPQEIREANIRLLNATLKYGYDELRYKEGLVEKTKEEIQALRERLKELMERRHDYEEWINETYLFFHGILGPEIIEKIDRERLR